ncbi:MAG: histidine phosphatase family protein [Firmicutes bacterium]|nr:histidine phosphatase family protein [Bacillota bacterium]
MAIFYLVRHGVTEWNRERRIQGQLDVELTEEGREQARRAGRALVGEGIEYIYTSDLSRARETARIIAAELQIPIAGSRRELREIDFGRWEGLGIEEIGEKDPEVYARWRENRIEMPTPGGESFRMLADRSVKCIDHLAAKHPQDKMVVVTHGGPIIHILGAIMKEDLKKQPLFRIANCSITTVTYNPAEDDWQILAVNDIRHLNGDK